MDVTKYASLVIDHTGYACNVIDVKTYEILYMSKSYIDMYELTNSKDYQGKKCYQLLHGLDNPCSFCSSDKLKLNQPFRWEHFNNKLQCWFDITDFLVQFDGRLCRIGIAKEMVVQTGKQRHPFSQATMEEVLFYCLHVLTREKDLNIAINLFLESIGEYYQANRAYIFEFDLDQKTLSNTFEWYKEGVSVEINNLQNMPITIVENWVKKFETTGEFVINSLNKDLDIRADVYHILEAQGIQSLLAVPLFNKDQVIGFIGVDVPQNNSRNLVLLRSVAAFVQEEMEKRRLIIELEKISFIDVLTGLKNRNYYNRVLDDFHRKTPEKLGIVTLDINGMREINDTHGREYGDHIIKQTADILREQFSKNAYRISGDEFVALCTDISNNSFKEKIVALRHAFKKADIENIVSLGFAWNFNQDTVNIKALFQQAEEIRYAEKQSYYHSALREGRTLTRTGFMEEVLREIQEGRFLIYYQPQVSILTGKVIGAEALVRKREDDGVIIPPNKFLPFYEAGGVISHIDLFVMKEACKTLRKWIDQGHNLQISVNFSRITLLEPSIVEILGEICTEYGVSPSSITVEVTESIGKMDEEQLHSLMMKLKAVGFSISLDDFGSEYSNLAILSALDFDEIKFDRSLVNSIEDNEKSRVVIANGMNLCRALKNTNSLAEGIETKGQLDLLMEYRCDYGQGYYFSRPIPLDQFDIFLKQYKSH